MKIVANAKKDRLECKILINIYISMIKIPPYYKFIPKISSNHICPYLYKKDGLK